MPLQVCLRTRTVHLPWNNLLGGTYGTCHQGQAKAIFFTSFRLKHKKQSLVSVFVWVCLFVLRAAIKSPDKHCLPGVSDDIGRPGCAIQRLTLSLEKSWFSFLMGWLEWYHYTPNPICTIRVSKKACLTYQNLFSLPRSDLTTMHKYIQRKDIKW